MDLPGTPNFLVYVANGSLDALFRRKTGISSALEAKRALSHRAQKPNFPVYAVYVSRVSLSAESLESTGHCKQHGWSRHFVFSCLNRLFLDVTVELRMLSASMTRPGCVILVVFGLVCSFSFFTGLGTPGTFRVITTIFTIINMTWIANHEASFAWRMSSALSINLVLPDGGFRAPEHTRQHQLDFRQLWKK